jgi:hypothetical protein
MQNETLRQELSRLTDAHSELDREYRESAKDMDAIRTYVAARRPIRERMEQVVGMMSK